MMVLLLGVILNTFVFSSNGYAMPVKSDFEYRDDMHFTYQDKDTVRFWLLTDILGFETDKMLFKFSFGDVLIVFSIILLINSQIQMIRSYLWDIV